MTDDRRPSIYYYEQAQRIRQLAADAHSDETRGQFLTLAEQYERLASQACKTSMASPGAPQQEQHDQGARA
jgi:hypothetical protein